MSLFQFGIDYVVATLGNTISLNHIKMLYKITNKIIFCYDGDKSGRISSWRALIKILDYLEDGNQLNFIFLPEGEDPDSLIRKIGKLSFEKIIDSSISFSDFISNLI